MSLTRVSRSGDAVAIAALRVMLGLLFLSVWASNLHKGLYDRGPYAALIDDYVANGKAPAVWKHVMEFVADHAGVTSKLQLVTELAFGILLVVGLATPVVAASAGLFLSSLWLSEIGVPNEWIWSLVFPSLIAFYLALVSAGRMFGLDAIVLDRLPLFRRPHAPAG